MSLTVSLARPPGINELKIDWTRFCCSPSPSQALGQGEHCLFFPPCLAEASTPAHSAYGLTVAFPPSSFPASCEGTSCPVLGCHLAFLLEEEDFELHFQRNVMPQLMCSKLTISLGCQGSPIAHSSSSFPQGPSWPGMCTQATGYPSRDLLISGGRLLGVIYYEKYCWVLCQMLRTHR